MDKDKSKVTSGKGSLEFVFEGMKESNAIMSDMIREDMPKK